MKFGIQVGHLGGPLDELRRLWRFADDRGFEWFSVSDHFQETPVFGVFMVVVGVAQLAGGLLLLARPSGALVGGLVGSTVVLLALYAVAHTTGLPVGPRPWQPEHLHTIDLLCKGTELALLWVLVPLGGWTDAPAAGGRPRAVRSLASGPSIRVDVVADRP